MGQVFNGLMLATPRSVQLKIDVCSPSGCETRLEPPQQEFRSNGARVFWRLPRRVCGLAMVLGLLSGAAAGPSDALGTLTILDGEAVLLRGANRFALAEGVRIRAADIVQSGPGGRLLRFELDDGSTVALGPDTQAQFFPDLRPKAVLYLLQGWAKFSAAKAAPMAMSTPGFSRAQFDHELVVQVLPDGFSLFVEGGDLALEGMASGGKTISLKAGEWMHQGAGGKPERSPQLPGTFVTAMPRPFMDKLPSLAARFASQETVPKRVSAISYADLQGWLHAESRLVKANLPRWKPLAQTPEFRHSLEAGLATHPEWAPLLVPVSSSASNVR
jgi:hypothetical protein